jgi:hypothetical protein
VWFSSAVLTLLMHMLILHAADKKERDPTFRKQPQDVAASESVCAAAVTFACSKWLGRAQRRRHNSSSGGSSADPSQAVISQWAGSSAEVGFHLHAVTDHVCTKSSTQRHRGCVPAFSSRHHGGWPYARQP